MPRALAGEYISVASQKDAEEADIEKERAEQAKGPAAQQRELEELTQIYVQVSRLHSGLHSVHSHHHHHGSSCHRHNKEQ